MIAKKVAQKLLDSNPELSPHDEDNPLCLCGRRFYDHDDRGQVYDQHGNKCLCSGFEPIGAGETI